MSQMKTRALILPIALLLAVAGVLAQSGEAPHALPEDEVGLHKGSVFDAPAPPAVPQNTSDPGERPPLGRAHPEAPPATPHAVADLLPITRSENLCIDCHALEEKVEGEPTPIPASHFVDLRNAPGEAANEVVGSRWVCISCHVAQSDAPLLVGNDLRRPEAAAKSE